MLGLFKTENKISFDTWYGYGFFLIILWPVGSFSLFAFGESMLLS